MREGINKNLRHEFDFCESQYCPTTLVDLSNNWILAQWTSEYQLDTEYRTPQYIRVQAEFNLNRTSPAVPGGWADDTLGAAFKYGPNPPNPPIATGTSTPTPAPKHNPHGLRFLSFLVLLLPLAVSLFLCRRRTMRSPPEELVPPPLGADLDNGLPETLA